MINQDLMPKVSLILLIVQRLKIIRKMKPISITTFIKNFGHYRNISKIQFKLISKFINFFIIVILIRR